MKRSPEAKVPIRIEIRQRRPIACRLLACGLIFGGMTASPCAAEIFLGSGAKVGEITDRSAIVHVRLTKQPRQDEHGLLPGKNGHAQVVYNHVEPINNNATKTDWKFAHEDYDYSVQFRLTGLMPATRYFYKVRFGANYGEKPKESKAFSFLTAPAPDDRKPVVFQVTTGQDVRGSNTYQHMKASKPHFLVSTGDNVYYDHAPHLGRDIQSAFRSYQYIYGDPMLIDYFRHTGGYFQKDDHDYRFNDADPFQKGKWLRKSAARPGAIAGEFNGNQLLDVNWLSHEDGMSVFRRVWPMSAKTYRTFRWGKGLQIWLLEGRDFRSPNRMPDGPDKSIWGEVQKSWLKSTLMESNVDWRIVISPTPIVGPDRSNKRDNHANRSGFWHEGQEFLDWVQRSKLDNLILVCGDRHWQYHSIDPRGINEFSCGPTCDEHTQQVPPIYEGYRQPYAASRGGFLQVNYHPNGRRLDLQFYDESGNRSYRCKFPR